MIKHYSKLSTLVFIFIFGIMGALVPVREVAGVEFPNPLVFQTFQEFLNRILEILVLYSIPIVVALIAYAGLLIIISGDNPGRQDTAKNILKYSLIGYGIILGARMIVAAVSTLI